MFPAKKAGNQGCLSWEFPTFSHITIFPSLSECGKNVGNFPHFPTLFPTISPHPPHIFPTSFSHLSPEHFPTVPWISNILSMKAFPMCSDMRVTSAIHADECWEMSEECQRFPHIFPTFSRHPRNQISPHSPHNFPTVGRKS